MQSAAAFLGDERGVQTVEFVLWVPIILALIVVTVDAATLYLTHNEMWNVARDTARRMSTGRITSAAEAEAYAVSAVKLRDYPYSVDASFDPDTRMQVVIGMSFEDISILGYGMLGIIGGTIVARVSMRSSPNLVLPGGVGNGSGGNNGGGNS